MRLEDYQRKVWEEIFGHYAHGEIDQVPENYFSDTLNIDYNTGEWFTRCGLSTAITLGYGSGNGKVRRFAAFADISIGPLVLILDDAGNLYTFSVRAGDTATTPRLTVAGATDFVAIKMLGKIFIAFSDGEFGTSGEFLKVFIPHPTIVANDEFRNAAGLAPTAGGPMVAVDGAAGIVNAGLYKIAVAYETTSGFITPPGPKIAGVFTPTSYTSPGSVKINLSNIPTGPAGTAKRRILITKAGLEEYFFLGSLFGGIINDNVTTTAILDFDDTTDLVESADYLFDLRETVPMPLGLQDYSGRLVTFGDTVDPSILRVSRAGEPEAFDSVDGIVFVNKDDGFTCRASIVIRDVFYSCKNLGVYSVRDNGNEPSSWPVAPIDRSINTCIHGIGEFFDLSGITMARDWTLMADRSGILLFDGIARKPPITDNISDIWATMNFAKYHKLVIAIDEQNHKIYCSFPTGAATENNKIIMADYNECPGKIPQADSIKWAVWEFRPSNLTKNMSDIGLFGVPPDTVPTLKLGSVDGGGRIWRLDCASTGDDIFGVADFTDDFNRANGKPNVGQPKWQNDVNHLSPFDIVSNRIRITGGGVARPLPLSGTGASTFTDQFAELEFIGLISGTLIQGGVLNRSQGFVFPFDQGYAITLDNNHASTKGMTVYRYFQSGPNYGFSALFGATAPTVFVTGDKIGLRIVGTTLSALMNGAVLNTGTNALHASGYLGMFMGGGSPGVLDWDNFRGGSFPENSVAGDIESYWETSLLYWEPGNVHFFTAARFRIIGSGTLLCTIRGEDDVLPASLPSITLATAPGREFLIRFNFQNEKARIKARLTTGRFVVSKLEVFGKPVYTMRPA